jgi:hypothetical protein
MAKQKGVKKTVKKEARARRPGTSFAAAAAAAIIYFFAVKRLRRRDAPHTHTLCL